MLKVVQHSFAMVAALGVVGWMVNHRPPAEPAETPQALAPETHDAPTTSGGFTPEETVIERDASGQFHIDLRVNGQETRFLVDTGADTVALTQTDAERLGIRAAPDDYLPIVRTASGVGHAAMVRIDRLEFGHEEFQGVEALVAEGLEVNLLGQSVLRRLGRVELQGDRMVIAHR